MKFRYVSAVLGPVLAVSAPTAAAQTGTIQGAYVGCRTEAQLDEFVQAAIRKDRRQGEALLNKVCVLLRGREFSIVERGWAYSRVRVYVGEDSIVLWVQSGALGGR
jgi:hypothetical protein